MGAQRDFGETVRSFIIRACRSDVDLARLTGISPRTIENWRTGLVRRPRLLIDLLKLARALSLNGDDTTILLMTAGHPSLEVVYQQAQQTRDFQLLDILHNWPTAAATAPSDVAISAQLRPPIADFVGKANEIAQLVGQLRTTVSNGRGAVISGVQGMGGIGKTELAYVVTHQVREIFPDAQIVLNLGGTSATPLPPAQALQSVIRTFKPDATLPDDLEALQVRYYAVLQGQRVLILADDARDAAQVRWLVPPLGCALLVTSRQRFTLPGMMTVDLEALSMSEATALLHMICHRLSMTEAERIARACHNLPLALRISGGILRNDPALSVATYLERLVDERQRLAQLRDPDDQQLDVAASLALSYTQLDPAVQQVFRQLGVLVADFATPLALAIVEAEVGVDVVETLHFLVRRNLIMYDAEQARWQMHDLVRMLALRYLEAAGEFEASMWRYARAAVAIAQNIQEQYRADGDTALVALTQFDAEQAHIDAAHRWALLHAETPDGDQLLLDTALATCQIGEIGYNHRKETIPLLAGNWVCQSHHCWQEIGYAKITEHAVLVARLEAGEVLLAGLLNPASQRAFGADQDAPIAAIVLP